MSNLSYKDLVNVNEVIKRVGITEGMLIGDFGCGGSGVFALPLAKKIGDKGRLYCVDILEKAISALEGLARIYNLHNIEMVWSDLEKYNRAKITSASLDTIFLTNILHQSRNQKNILEESLRILKQKGHLVIMERTEIGFKDFPTNHGVVTKNEIEGLCRECNLTKVDEFEPTKYYFTLVYKKN